MKKNKNSFSNVKYVLEADQPQQNTQQTNQNTNTNTQQNTQPTNTAAVQVATPQYDETYIKQIQAIETEAANKKAQALTALNQRLMAKQKEAQTKQNSSIEYEYEQYLLEKEDFDDLDIYNSDRRRKKKKDNMRKYEDPLEIDESDEEMILLPREVRYLDDEEDVMPDYVDDDELDDDNVERASIESDDEWENDNSVFYVLIEDDAKGQIVLKVYRVSLDDDWLIDVKFGENESLDHMAFDSEYEKVQILDYIAELFDDVEEITENQYNEIIDEIE
jgi:hypothetical protein